MFNASIANNTTNNYNPSSSNINALLNDTKKHYNHDGSPSSPIHTSVHLGNQKAVYFGDSVNEKVLQTEAVYERIKRREVHDLQKNNQNDISKSHSKTFHHDQDDDDMKKIEVAKEYYKK